ADGNIEIEAGGGGVSDVQDSNGNSLVVEGVAILPPFEGGGGVTQSYVDDADTATLQAALNADLDLGTTAGTAAAGNDSRILNGETAYQKRITGLAVTGTSTKTITITLADG